MGASIDSEFVNGDLFGHHVVESVNASVSIIHALVGLYRDGNISNGTDGRTSVRLRWSIENSGIEFRRFRDNRKSLYGKPIWLEWVLLFTI